MLLFDAAIDGRRENVCHQARGRNRRASNRSVISARLKINLVSCRGFSLTEILVVIAIIALLVAILFPIMGSVRTAALGMHCQSNLRQTGMGTLAFANENNGCLPQLRNPSAEGGGGPYMYNQICDYLDQGGGATMTAKLLQCPGEPWHYSGGARGDYAPNSYYVKVTGSPTYLGKRWSAVEMQSSTFLMVDARYRGFGFWNVHMDHMRKWGIIQTLDANGKPWPPRHGNGMKWLFFDLHVEHLSTAQILSKTSAELQTLTGYPVP
jgi:prepilin-type N-terminal cleavage/methylation domain-containing protein/prepilin-type processing-associated H-X9-DG protein